MTRDTVLPRGDDRRRRRAGWWIAAGVVLLLALVLALWAAARTVSEPPGPAGPTSTTGRPTPTDDRSPSPSGSAPTTTATPTATPTDEPTGSTRTPSPSSPSGSTSSPTGSPTTSPTMLTLRATAGSGQSSDIGSPYTLPLTARVTTTGGAPVAGVRVAFSAPTAGASGTFGSGACTSGSSATTCVAQTRGDGTVATSSLWANRTAGSFVVSARIVGGTTTVGFALTNGEPFDVTLGAVAPQLFPGAAPSPIPLRLTNPNPFPISVVLLTIAAHNASCDPATNIALRQVDLAGATTPGRIVVPAHASISLPAQGVARPTIALLNLPFDQTPTCAGQTFTLTSSGIAQP